MGQLVEFPLRDGGSVLVEAPMAVATWPVTRGRGGEITERAQCTFEQALERVEPAAHAIIARLRRMPQAPDEVRVEFGLDLHAEAGAFIASASATANFKVTVTWRRAEGSGE